MILLRTTAAAALLASVAVWSSSIGGVWCEETAAAATSSSTAQDECGLFLAISSTSTADSLTWGLYAGKDIPQGQPIGPADVAINMIHMKANVAFDEAEDPERFDFLNRVLDFLESFIWVPEPAGAKFDVDHGRAVTAIPGAGVLGSFNPRLTNAYWNHANAYLRPPLNEVTGETHPGRGAYSPFYNAVVDATQDIVKGGEIFMDYGENWQEEDKKEELSNADYKRLDTTVQKMSEFFEKHKDELDAESKKHIYAFLTNDVMNAAVGNQKSRKISKILPNTPDKLKDIHEAGGVLAYSAPDVYRKISWLQQHGRCMDHIMPGPSTIPHAGRGAFATRRIPAGGLVSPVPLLQIPDKAILDMYNVEAQEDGEYIRVSNEIIGKQLLLNYCYGHPDSDIVFFPAGTAANLINHAPTTTTSGEDGQQLTANTKMVWSTHPSHQKSWLSMSPKQLIDDEQSYLGLLMEIVATRDIEAGEEVLMDYGPEWTAAWKKHSATWQQQVSSGKVPSKWPTRALDLNHKYATQPYPTEQEQDEYEKQGDVNNIFPENVNFMAFLMVEESKKDGSMQDPKDWGLPDRGTVFDADNLFEMQVVNRTAIDYVHEKFRLHGLAYNYTIRWTNSRGMSTYVDNVPHAALLFVDAPETGDQFVDDAFRHYIGIPDDIFPQGPWRNRL